MEKQVSAIVIITSDTEWHSRRILDSYIQKHMGILFLSMIISW